MNNNESVFLMERIKEIKNRIIELEQDYRNNVNDLTIVDRIKLLNKIHYEMGQANAYLKIKKVFVNEK